MSQELGTRHITIYPESYGAVGNGAEVLTSGIVTGATGTDDTAAFQACIDDAIKMAALNHNVTIELRPVTYRFSSAPRTDRLGNSVLTFAAPNGVSTSWAVPGSITMRGVPGMGMSWFGNPTRLLCDYNGGATYQTSGGPNNIGHGPPSFIGATTKEAAGTTTTQGGATVSVIDNGQTTQPIQFQHMLIATVKDSPLAGVDTVAFGGIDMHNVGVTAQGGALQGDAPNSNKWTFGIRLPKLWGTFHIRLSNVCTRNYYAGIVFNKLDHHHLDRVYTTTHPGPGIAFQDGEFTSGHSNIPSNYITMSNPIIVMSGWDPVDGACSLGDHVTGRRGPAAARGSDPDEYPDITPFLNDWQFSLEFGPPAATSFDFNDGAFIVDNNNYIYGQVRVNRFFTHAGGSGYDPDGDGIPGWGPDHIGATLGDVISNNVGPVYGGENLDIRMSSHPNLVTARNSEPNFDDILSGQLQMWFDLNGGLSLEIIGKNALGTAVSKASIPMTADGLVVPDGANAKGVAVHGGNADFTRPSGYDSVEWIGSVAPNNAHVNDTWIDTNT
jgi:hypothetical protein